MWREFNPNNQARIKIMENTLFTSLSINEEANLSGGQQNFFIGTTFTFTGTGGPGGSGAPGGPGGSGGSGGRGGSGISFG